MVVSSRTLKGLTQQGQHYSNGVKAATELGTYPNGSQVTDSYRTSGGRPVGVKQYEDLTGPELRQAVNREYTTRFDNGHPFKTEKYEIKPQLRGEWLVKYGTTVDRYIGDSSITEVGFASMYPSASLAPDQSQREADGRRAIGMTAPTAPEAALGQFLVELREKLPQLVGTSITKHGINSKTLGDENLNVQFGILPTKSDLQEIANSVLNANKIVNQLKRDSEQHVRRRVTLNESSVFQKVANSTLNFSLPRRNLSDVTSLFVSSWGTRDTYDIIRHRSWFSGAYTYHLTEANDFISNIQAYAEKANHLLGLELTPELIWEVTPWSWLFDWFADFGNFVHNVTAFSEDNLVLRYGYMMHETHADRVRTLTGMVPMNYGKGPGLAPQSLSLFASYSCKQRTRSTPYGFGVNLSSLSPRRWAILGSLGLTKAPTSLRIY